MSNGESHIPHNVMYHPGPFHDQPPFSPLHQRPFTFGDPVDGQYFMPQQPEGFPGQFHLQNHSVSPITPGSYTASAHSSSPVVLGDQFAAYHHSPWSATALHPLAPVDSVLPDTGTAWQDTGQHDPRLPIHIRSSPSVHSDARSLDFQQLSDAGPTQLLVDAAVEQQDDDYYDISDDEDGSRSLSNRQAEQGLMNLIQNKGART